VDLAGARQFFVEHGGAVVLKAMAGGGGRGMRVVTDGDDLEQAVARCRGEALAAFGSDAVYVEALVPRARHVEVQVVGDGRTVVHLGERECSLQRRHQKLVEVAPAPGLDPAVRAHLCDAAVRMAESVHYRGLGTFEFLVGDDSWVFIEANPRLQVEHTVTEEVYGVDLVAVQLQLAGGATLTEVGLAPDALPTGRGHAMQLRINAERLTADGTAHPTTGTIERLLLPGGPGVRVDTAASPGTMVDPRFDPLVVKLITHRPGGTFPQLVDHTRRVLDELRIDGVETNVGLLANVLARPEVAAGQMYTRFVEDHLAELVPSVPDDRTGGPEVVDPSDALTTGVAVVAPLVGTVTSVEVEVGDGVVAGAPVLIIEAMKMEHVVVAGTEGWVSQVTVSVGQTVSEGQVLARVEPAPVVVEHGHDADTADPDRVRADLAEVLERQWRTRDEARPDVVERRHGAGRRTARENVDDLCDPGSYVEYGSLVVAAQRRRRSLDDLIARTPADGMVAGIGSVNGHLFGPESARCAVMSYDYTVLAGTQGQQNHRKKDRLFELAERWRLPVVLFSEGGGGRPGDTDALGVAGLDCLAFAYFAALSGLVPLVGIASGYCFAGNAALLGCCDVVIATEGSNIGMGGPAMIEGGGLGVFPPTAIGPLGVQVANGVVDVAVADEAEAVAVAKQYLSYFQGPVDTWESHDQRLLRSVIPENRLRVYDVRRVIDLIADVDSVLELRSGFGHGMVTALVRVEGRPLGVVANNPAHLGGAIDADGADKAARFMQLCDAFDLPILSLCDTPGIMVGPDAETTALVRHCSRLFVTGASVTVPFLTVVLRKGYGLGAQAMAAGSFKAPLATVAWPTGEFGGMGLEGAVRLGYRKELDAIEDPAERQATYEQMVARMYEHGKAVSMASHFEIDDVIDPVDTRRLITRLLDSVPPPPKRTGKKRPMIDTW
jgi:acetyl-CoA carboxylase carboxyltransferase component/biotin carboxylase